VGFFISQIKRRRTEKGRMIAEKINSNETVTFKELLMSDVIEQESLVNLLEKIGIITKAELLEEIRRLRDKKKRVGA